MVGRVYTRVGRRHIQGGIPTMVYPGITTFSQKYPDSLKPPKDTRMVNDYERFNSFDRFDIPGYSRVDTVAGTLNPATLINFNQKHAQPRPRAASSPQQ